MQVWIGGRWFAVVGILDAAAARARDRPVGARRDREAAATYLDTDGVADHDLRRARTGLDRRRAAGPAGDRRTPSSPEEVAGRAGRRTRSRRGPPRRRAFTALFLGLGAVALLVGGLGIANVMLMAVLERRNGDRPAPRAGRDPRAHRRPVPHRGAAARVRRRDPRASPAARPSRWRYATTPAWLVVVPLAGAGAGLGAAVAVGAIAGLYPALRASSVPPTDALRSRLSARIGRRDLRTRRSPRPAGRDIAPTAHQPRSVPSAMSADTRAVATLATGWSRPVTLGPRGSGPRNDPSAAPTTAI